MLFIEFNSFKKDPLKYCKIIFENLGLSSYEPDISKIHNQSKIPRFRIIQKLFNFISDEENILKKGLKKVIPYKTFTYLGHKIRNLNQTNKEHGKMDPYIEKKLFEYYKQDITKFEKISGMNLEHWYR